MVRSKKDVKLEQTQKENEILRRILYWVGMAAILEILILLVNRYFFHYKVGTDVTEVYLAEKLIPVFQVFQFAGFILAAALLVWLAVDYIKGKETGIFRFILAGFFAVLALACILFLQIGSGCIPVLLVSVPAFAGLVMVFYLYQREFFVVALAGAVGIFGLWLFRTVGTRWIPLFYAYLVFALAFMAVIAVLALLLRKSKGRWKVKTRVIELLKKEANYLTIFLSCALTAVLLLAAVPLGATFAYYAMLALVVWIFIMAVYFTSKLMYE